MSPIVKTYCKTLMYGVILYRNGFSFMLTYFSCGCSEGFSFHLSSNFSVCAGSTFYDIFSLCFHTGRNIFSERKIFSTYVKHNCRVEHNNCRAYSCFTLSTFFNREFVYFYYLSTYAHFILYFHRLFSTKRR